jgi:Ca2+-binding RTX toxin-like protein
MRTHTRSTAALAVAGLGLTTLAALGFSGPASAAPASGYECRGVAATIVGTNGADEIEGTRKRDVIVALAGNDEIDGNGGNDLICAGAGRDDVDGGSGNDRIYQGSEPDHDDDDRYDD